MLALWLGFACGSWALDPAKAIHQYRHKIFRRENGLPSVAIRGLAQTSDGYLWISSVGGLTSFDGVRFRTVYSSNSTLRPESDRDGNLWAIANQQVLLRQQGQTRLFGEAEGIDPKAAAYSRVTSTSDGSVWVLNANGLHRFNGGRFLPYPTDAKPPQGEVRAFRGGPNSDLWIAYFGKGIGHIHGRSFRLYGLADGLPTLLVTALAFDAKGRLWIGSSEGIGWLGDDGRYQSFPLPAGVPSKSVEALLFDRKGTLWLGTKAGLIRYAHGQFDAMGAEELSNDQVYHIVEDSEGDLWLGTHDGLDEFVDTDLTPWTKADGLPYKSFGDVCVDGGGAVHALGYHQAPLILTGEKFASDPSVRVDLWAQGPPVAQGIACRSGTTGFWLSVERRGAYLIDGGVIRRHVTWPGFENDVVPSLAEDERGTLWIGTLATGLKSVGLDGSFRSYHLANSSDGQIWCLLPDRHGSVWVGTTSGASVIEIATKRIEALPIDPKFGLVVGFFADRDCMWISGNGGLLFRDATGQLGSIPVAATFGQQAVYNVLNDELGYTWIKGNHNVVRLRTADLRNLIHHHERKVPYRLFGPADGQTGELIASNNAIAREANGRLWFTTTAGLLTTIPAGLADKLPARPLLLEEIAIDGKPVSDRSEVRLRARANRLELRWTAAALARPDAIQFYYQLIPFDRSPLAATDIRKATYTNLPPGTYHFNVTADYVGSRSQLASPISIVQQPSFYQTVVFRLFSIAAIGLLAWIFYKLRLRQMRHEYSLVLHERMRIARELHDTVLRAFTGLLWQLQGTLQQASGIDKNHPLQLALQQTREQLGEARRAVFDLRSAALDGTDLPAAMASLAESDDRCKFFLEGEGRPISPATESALLRVAQEALANARQHAGASSVELHLCYERYRIGLVIRDDGAGFDPRHTNGLSTKHFGLQGMRERVEAAGGKFQLHSAPGKGTQVQAEFPLGTRLRKFALPF